MLVVAAVATGCSYPGSAAVRSPLSPPAVTLTEDVSEPSEGESESDVDEMTELASELKASPTTQSPLGVDLSPERGTLYPHAIQVFSPELESWVVDHEAGEVV